jgi:hypothetical protein
MTGKNGENGDEDENEVEDVADVGDVEDVEDVEGDNVGDISVEINVEELVAKIESTDSDDSAEKAEIRKKLDKIRERQDENLDGTYNFNLDDDV